MCGSGTLDKIMNAAGIVGCCVMGGLIVNYDQSAVRAEFYHQRYRVQYSDSSV